MNSESKITLARKALRLIGVTLDSNITDLDGREQNAVTCREEWDLARDELLKLHAWSFATRRANLSLLADAPLFGWKYAWALPEDYIQMLEFNCVPGGTGITNFEVEDGNLLSHPLNVWSVVDLTGGATPTSHIRYTYRNETVSAWSANFCNAFIYMLAAGIAPGLSASPALGMQMRQAAESMVLKAFGPQNNETRPRAIRSGADSGYLRARYSGPGGGYPYNVPQGMYADSFGVWQWNTW